MSSKLVLLPFVLVLAACGGAEQPGESPDNPAPDAAGAEAPTETASAASATGLSAYVGKYPFDEVDGVTWNDNPAVKAAIDKAVTDAAVRKTIAETPGPSAPIELVEGKVAAWGCEQHNCGPHQWTVLVDPASGAADVCYFNEDADSASSRWFLASGSEEKRAGNCQVGEG